MIAVTAMLPGTAHADAYCVGLVNEAATYGDGTILILPAWRGDWITICNLTNTWNGVSPQSCFAWFSQVQTAVAARRNLGVYYGGLTQAQCAAIGTYSSAPGPLYVRSPP